MIISEMIISVRTYSHKMRYSLCWLLVLLFLGSLVQASSAQSSVVLDIFVSDADHRPISGARLVVERLGYRGGQSVGVVVARLIANDSGGTKYTGPTGRYAVSAVWDDERTAGIDSVPQRESVELGPEGHKVLNFSLQKGASLLLDGFLFFPWAPAPLIFQNGYLTSQPTPSATEYDSVGSLEFLVRAASPKAIQEALFGPWMKTDFYYDIGLVPIFSSELTSLNITINTNAGSITIAVADFLPSVIEVGSIHTISLEAVSKVATQAFTESYYTKTLDCLEEMKVLGFFLTRTNSIVSSVRSILDQAKANFSESDGWFVLIRRSYQTLGQVNIDMNDYRESSMSTAKFIPLFVAIASALLSSLIIENRRRRIISMCLLYLVSMSILSYATPGLRMWPSEEIMPVIVLSLVGAVALMWLLPSVIIEPSDPMSLSPVGALVLFFSIGARTLKRRGVRSVGLLIVMATSVAGFIMLTSFGFSLNIQRGEMGGGPPFEAMMIRKADFLQVLPLDQSMIIYLSQQKDVASAYVKFENAPRYSPSVILQSTKGTLSFNGILVMDFVKDPMGQLFKQSITFGRLPSGSDELMISSRAASLMGLSLGDSLTIANMSFQISGLLDDALLLGLKDVDGLSVLPKKMVQTPAGATVVVCNPEEVIFVMKSDTNIASFPNLICTRLVLNFKGEPNLAKRAENYAYELGEGFTVFFSRSGVSHWLAFEPTFCQIGLWGSLLVLTIAGLSIGVESLGGVYERRKEITIMSSIGLNPSHVVAMVISESLVLGLLGAFVGYIVGTSAFPFLNLLGISIEVDQKVSSNWALLAVAIASIVSFMGSAFPSLKASTLVTPSLLRRWGLLGKVSPEKPVLYQLPIQIRRGEAKEFVDFIWRRLGQYSGMLYENVWRTGKTESSIHYVYHRSDAHMNATKNAIDLVPISEDLFGAVLEVNTQALSETVARTSADLSILFARKAILEWSERRRIQVKPPEM